MRRTPTSAKARQRDSVFTVALLYGLVLCISPSSASEDDQPDMAFLEYLGSWEEGDEDWLMLHEPLQEVAQEDTRSDPVPEGEESTEKQNES